MRTLELQKKAKQKVCEKLIILDSILTQLRRYPRPA